ncbi:RDD family protein [Hymenobacter metallilatus]|nr:RDD family protein [Hymenobacter metallilatus]
MEHVTLSTEYTTEPTLIRAGQGRRLANLLIDSLAIFAMIFGLGVVLAATGQEALLDSLDNGLLERLLFIVLSVAYYLIMEGLFGRTLGKILTRTRVVTDEGLQPSFGDILKRTAWRIVPFDGLSFLGDAYGWHDSRSNTMVVRD